jgi:ATPase with chaperone activity, ATP-binding domain, diverged
MKKSKINWEKTSAAIFRADLKRLRAVVEFDAQNLDDLVGLDAQKIILCENTQKFLDGIGGTNALLWGERGCGKSSLCKGVFTKFMNFNLKIIEISRDDLKFLPRILDQIRELPYKFIIYCDDLSFETGENGYKFLRPLLDGSIEKAPQNVLMYATSNRRHIVTEHASVITPRQTCTKLNFI